MRVEAVLPWALRVSCGVLPFTAGPALADALDPRSATVRSTASALLWGVWAIGVLAVLVPRPWGLTLLRVAAPALLAAAVATAIAVGAGVSAVGAVASAVVATALAHAPETGFLFVNGAAYGDERRHLLRAPGAVLAGPLALAWAALVAAVVAGPLLLACHLWALGAAATVVGLPAAAVLARAVHSLTQRWAVFVPAGLVLRDHLALADPVLFRRQEVELLRPAPADTDALDLTVRAPGLALELRLQDKVAVMRVVLGRRGGEPGSTARLLFTPTRPGAVLADARARRIRVG